MEDNEYYSVHRYAHTDGEDRVKLDVSVSVNLKKSNLPELIQMPAEELEAMREESKAAAKGAMLQLEQSSAEEWATQAAQAILLKKALEYVRTLPVKHTSNIWTETSNRGHFEISNMVYKMTYHIYDRTEYDRKLQKSVPVAWYVNWDVSYNVPREYYSDHYYSRSGAGIADQRDKRYTDKAAAEKYLQGRIAAYAHLFTELSPPIPEDKTELFTINGILLPGYTVAAHEPTPDELLDFIGEADLAAPAPTQKETSQQRAAAKKQAHNRHVKGR